MKVIATIDYWDGTKSRASQPTELEDVIGQIRLVLCEKGVAGITITRLPKLSQIGELTGRAACPSVNPSTDGEAHDH